MRLLILLAVFALSGCLTTPERDPIIITKTVEVPVAVKCVISYPKEPSHKVTDVPSDATAYHKARGALQELEGQRQYAKELRAALTTCAEDR